MRRSSRKPSNVPESLHQRLNSYALAASAAGVGMLALAQPAEAKIIYTPAHKRVQFYHRLVIDLNHDGVPDFALSEHVTSLTTYVGLSLDVITKPSGNKVVGKKIYASDLRAGVKIDGSQPFLSGVDAMAANFCTRTNQKCGFYLGPWANGGKGVRGRYLGLKFVVHGHTHYGWARFNVSVSLAKLSATLTGYAYETIPNKPIIAGKTHGKDVITVEPASLGHLARGASAIPAWRTKESR
jgi:hypothetical protein